MSIENDKLKIHVSEQSRRNIETWLNEPKYKDYIDEIESLIQDEKWQELEDSFFKVLEFGTAGRRGKTGVGSNRINKVTMGESAQALCNYAASQDPDARSKGVVIACDTRLSSDELSKYVASVCAANGFKTYIFDEFRSTPELSFAVRHLETSVGIVVSASHNPPADNGFKAYWSDGCQLVSPHDRGVMDEVSKVVEINQIDFDDAADSGDIELIGRAVDLEYYKAAANESENECRDISIVYSPLHGAGQTNVLPVLRELGFDNISAVGEQMIPDGNFPTIESRKPNPEDKAANKMAVDKMLNLKSDIAITNDPDADRFGVIVRQDDSPIYLTGNQSLVLATDYVLGRMKERGDITRQHFLAKTIVTTDMVKAITDDFGVRLYDKLLIGFKYIGELVGKKEKTSEKFILAGEESFGFLKGDYARDKDGTSGALVMAEYAAQLRAENKTLFDRLCELYAIYGLFVESLVNVELPGSDGFNEMTRIMESLRVDTPRQLAGYEVTAFNDFQTLKRTNYLDNETNRIDSIYGNVVSFELGDPNKRVTVRPSGTEPKLKLYIQWKEEAVSGNVKDISEQYAEVEEMLKDLGGAIKEQITVQ